MVKRSNAAAVCAARQPRRGRPTAWSIACLASALCFLAANASAVDAFGSVRPGDSGSILLPVHNDSSGTIVSVSVSVTEKPQFFRLKDASETGEIDIYPHKDKSFRIHYLVDANLAEPFIVSGADYPFTVNLKVTATDPLAIVAPQTQSISFTLLAGGKLSIIPTNTSLPEAADVPRNETGFSFNKSNTAQSAPWVPTRSVRIKATDFTTLDVYDSNRARLLTAYSPGPNGEIVATFSGLVDAEGYCAVTDEGTPNEVRAYFNKDHRAPAVGIDEVIYPYGRDNTRYEIIGSAGGNISDVAYTELAGQGQIGGKSFDFVAPVFCGAQDIAAYSKAWLGNYSIASVLAPCVGTGPYPGMQITISSSPWKDSPDEPVNLQVSGTGVAASFKDLQNAEKPAVVYLQDPPVQLPSAYVSLTQNEAWSVQASADYGGEAYVDLAFSSHPFTTGRPFGVFFSNEARMLAVNADGSVTDVTQEMPGNYSVRGQLTDATLYTVAITSRVAALLFDTTAPVTNLAFSGQPSLPRSDGVFLLSTGPVVAFNAQDPSDAELASGLAATRYLIDQEFQNIETTSGTLWNSVPFSLAEGEHEIIYFSTDTAGDVETPKHAHVKVTGGFYGATAPGTVHLASRSSTTLELAWDANGAPSGSVYSVRLSTGCQDLPATPAVGVEAPAAAFSGLPSASVFTAVVCGSASCSPPLVVQTGNGGLETDPAPVPIFCGAGKASVIHQAAALDPSAGLWETAYSNGGVFLAKHNANGIFISSTPLPGATSGDNWNIGFDGSGDAYALLTGVSSTTLYEVAPQGGLLSNMGYPALNGQVSAIDSDGDALWIAGVSSGSAALWKADAAGLSLAALSPVATARAVLANGRGTVWLAGARTEAALWRYDLSKGNMTRYDWTNTAGGMGSSAQALLEDTSGNIWLSGWARTQAGVRAALWQWDGTAISLVAISSVACSDQAQGLDLDAAGRFWVSGSAQLDSSGSARVALWQYSVFSGDVLNITDLYAAVPTRSPTNVGPELVVSGSNLFVLGTRNDGSLTVQSRAPDLGSLSGVLNYPAGFSGGSVYFFGSNTSDFQNAQQLGALPAPISGTTFDYILSGLPAPATYYVAAAYDLTGYIADGGQGMGPGNPLGGNFSAPLFLRASSVTAPAIGLALDQQPPNIAIFAPMNGSTIPAASFALSGTASDTVGINAISWAVADLTDGTWWDPDSGVFVSTTNALWNEAARSGPAAAETWSAAPPPVLPGKLYAAYARAVDFSGNIVVATATVVTTSTGPAEPGYAVALGRDGSGNIWTVTQDYDGDTPTTMSLRKHDSAGNYLAATVLPEAVDSGNFGIGFGPSGNWVGGTNSSGLAVWKVAGTGQVLLASAAYAGSNGFIYSGGAIVDGSGNAYVSGAEQTSPDPTSRLGLWKYGSNGSLAPGFPKNYQRSGGSFDGGLATGKDSSGNIWSAGVSSDPSTGNLDLALWKYAPNGDLVSGFPVFWPQAFANVQGNMVMGLRVSQSGTAWVAASKAYPSCPATDLALLRFNSNGVLVSTSLWHNAAGTSVAAKGLALDPAGNPWVVGNSSTTPAVWKFDISGNLAPGYPRTDPDGFDNDLIALDGAGTPWVVESADPEVFAGTMAVAGATGPNACSLSGSATISGTITNPLGFVAGSTVTIIVSTDGFSAQPMSFPVIAAAGTTLAYAVTLPAPASYRLGAFAGTDLSRISSATEIGVYGNFSLLAMASRGAAATADFTIALDTVPPTTAITSIVNGSTITNLALVQGTAQDNAMLDGTVEVAAQDLVSGSWWNGRRWLASDAPIYARVGGAGGLQESVTWTLDARSTVPVSGGGGLNGLANFLSYGHGYRLSVRTVDLAGNAGQPALASFTWQGPQGPVDLWPPRTSLVFGAPAVLFDELYVSGVTTFSLSAVDDFALLHDSAGAVSQTYLWVDAATPSPYVGQSTFTLSEGPHTISFWSVDSVGSQESTQTVSVVVDTTAPTTALQILGPSLRDSQGGLLVSTATQLALSAFDPVSNGVAADLDNTYYTVDVDISSPACENVPEDASQPAGTCANEAYGGPFTLSLGTHTIYYASEDNVANQELVNIATVTVSPDNLPPRTVLAVGLPNFSSGTLYATDATPLGIAAVDDFMSTGDAAGLGTRSFFAVDGGSFTLYAATFTLSGEGVHSVSYYSVDPFGNRESPGSSQVAIDATPPVTTLQVLGSSTTDNQGNLIFSATTQLALSAADPLSNGVASGVDGVYYTVDVDFSSPDCEEIAPDASQPAGTCANEDYDGAFTLSPGTHTIYFLAEDQVVNQETAHVINVTVNPSFGGHAAALDSSGRMWELIYANGNVSLVKRGANGAPDSSTSLPGGSGNDWHIGFDGSGSAYALLSGGLNTLLYEVSPQASLVSSTSYPSLGGRVTAVDSDGASLWIAGAAGAPGGAALWQASPSGLTRVGLFPGATAQAVLADGSGAVWLGGAASDTSLWRFDSASGNATRFDWVNTLGGFGSSAQALLEDTAGNIWLGGWIRTQTGVVAALWRWDGTAISLVATSTGAYSDQAQGLDLDAAGRFWLSGPTQTGSSGSSNLAVWQYPAGGGSALNLVSSYPDYPSAASGNAGIRLAVAGAFGYALGTASDGTFKVWSQVLGLGDLSVSLSYAAGFTGGNLFFILGDSPGLDDAQFLGPISAPTNGTTFDYTFTGLPAPATYYLAAVYDATGSLGSQPPFGNAPMGDNLTPTFVVPNSTASVPQIALAVDQQAPSVAIIAPASGSTTTASLSVISGTATDNMGVSSLNVGARNLTSGAWWDPASGAFVSTAPVWSAASHSGPFNSVSWTLSTPGLGSAILPYNNYAFYAQAIDPAGNIGFATSTLAMAGTISGTITYPGLSVGATVTIVVSTDGFNSRVFYPVTAQTGGSIAYSLSFPAPLDLQLGAIVGTDTIISSATVIGFYNHLEPVVLGAGSTLSGLDFSIALDTVAPSAAITSIVDASTITALGMIQGTSSDNVAVQGRVGLALQDRALGLWWDGQNRQWAVIGPVYDWLGQGPLQESKTWSVDASSNLSSGENYGGLAGYLTQGRTYTLYARALDLVGNAMVQPAAVSFNWGGPSGNVPPPAPAWITAQALSTTSIRWNWAQVDGAAGYTVFNSTAGPKQISLTANSWTLEGQTPNVARSRCVVSTNSFGESPMVCSPRIYTMAAVPSQLQALSVSAYSITWSWDASNNPAGTYYALFLSTDGFETNFSTPVPFSSLFQGSSTSVFGLASGTVYSARVRAANGGMFSTIFSSMASTQTLANASEFALNPSTGPIGIPFTITGTNFGTYNSPNTRVRFGTLLAPILSWSSTTIRGKVPGLSTGTFNVQVEIQQGTFTTVGSVGTFTVNLPVIFTLTPQSGPIRTVFTMTGTGFGPTNAPYTRVKINGKVAPLIAWNDLTIQGTVPGVSSGTQSMIVEVATPDGGLMQSATEFLVTVPAISTITPLAGPMGAPFTLSGANFGPYSSSYDRVKIGGRVAYVSLWSSATIQGTIPGTGPGSQSVVVERTTADGGLVASDTAYFTVTVPSVTLISPSTGPIGTIFTLTGTSFGPVNGAYTKVKVGGLNAPLFSWSDTSIRATVPGGLISGPQPVAVERTTTDGGLSRSNTVYFTVNGPYGSIEPVAGPIGIPFTITGTNFGASNSPNTRVRFGSMLANVLAWSDTMIQGTVPGLSTGTFSVQVEIQQGTSTTVGAAGIFSVSVPVVTQISPSFGPVGAAFTLTGTNFGPVSNPYTNVRVGGIIAPLTSWHDTSITATVPGGVGGGAQPVVVERTTADGGLSQSAAVYFTVNAFSGTIDPSSGPIRTLFTITGENFGTYLGGSTRVRFGALLAPISLWNATTIQGTVPGLSSGTFNVQIEVQQGTFTAVGPAGTFSVGLPVLSAVAPESGPIGAPFILTGADLGAFDILYDRVKVGGKTAVVIAWSSAAITATIPGTEPGSQPVVVERTTADGGLAASDTAYFTVTAPSVTLIVPPTGPVGTLFTLTGTSFGPVNDSYTKVKVGGIDSPLTSWHDTSITAAVPGGVGSGAQPVVVERTTADGGLSQSATVYFTVTGASGSIEPSSGPIRMSFTITGTNFGAYSSPSTRVRFGTMLAPILSWSSTTIRGTVPGLSTGTFSVQVEIQQGTSTAVSPVGAFFVNLPVILAMTPQSGPIGVPFTISGSDFGTYSSTYDRVKIGGKVASLVSWSSAAITGTIPGADPGSQPVIVERTTADGGIADSAAAYFTVAAPSVSSMNPSSAPIGVPFTIIGTGFGPYNGSNTRVKIGGVAAPISAWNDSAIQGTIPNVAGGNQTVIIERATSDGGLVSVEASVLFVSVPTITEVQPSSGPIGISLTVLGTSFGTYNGSNTRLRVDGTVASVSVWNDTTIVATVPAAPPGLAPVVVERATSDGGLSVSDTAYFLITAASVTAMTPSMGPIGVPFTITGTSFGTYRGSNTRVKFGFTAAPISVWNDSTIQGTIPGLDAGTYSVSVELQAGTTVAASSAGTFTVAEPAVATISPSTGPIGIPFTIAGTGFGPYNGANTRVKFGFTTAPISVWNDTLIQGTIPGLAARDYTVTVERQAGAGLAQSSAGTFTVSLPQVTNLSPLTGPIGLAFTLTGTSFGSYNGANTKVLVGGVAAPISMWNDATITGTIPGYVPASSQPVVVQRQTSDGGLAQSATVYFTVTGPAIASLNPSTGPIGIAFTITGTDFGTYNGSNTRVRFGTMLAPISVWNNTTIQGTVPGISSGTYMVSVERQAGSDVALSNPAQFLAVLPGVSTMTPVLGPIGIPFIISGSGFGTYNGSNTRVKIGGVAAPISVWNDATIQGTIPGLSPGDYAVVVERQVGAELSQGDAGTFSVILPQVSTMTPTVGPIGMPFTITGTGFGPYNGANTKVKVAGYAAPISVWNNTTISGRIPGQVSAGTQTVIVERITSGGGLADSEPQTFTVVLPQITQVTPSQGQAGSAFQLDGSGFGPYGGSATKVTFNGVAAGISLWNNTMIRGVVPSSLAVGTYTVVVALSPSGGTVQSNVLIYGVGTSGTHFMSMALAGPRPAYIPAWYGQASLALSAEEGGTVVTPSRVSVIVPPGALAEDTDITINPGAADGVDRDARLGTLSAAAMASAGEAVQLGPEGTFFAVPVTIELPYDPAAVAMGQDDKVAIHYWDPVARTWTVLPSQADAARRVVTARTDHFSLYQPLVPAGAAALASSSVADMLIACNPLRQSCQPMQFKNLPADARLRIYTLSGALVRDFNADALGQASWDGTNQSGAWVASGVYFVLVQGNGTKKTFKIAVQR